MGYSLALEITKNRYLEYKTAEIVLSNCLAIEEKYEMVLSNYLEFEKEVINASTSDMVREYIEYKDRFDVRIALNTRLLNLLSSVRLYADQISQNVSKIVPGQININNDVKALFSEEYNQKFEFRFMEALRNYTQHNAMPIHFGKFYREKKSVGEEDFFQYSINIYSLKSYLSEDDTFKKTILEEMDEEINLTLAARSYVGSISNVHDSIRGIVKEIVLPARELLENAHNEYSKESGEDSNKYIGLIAYKDEGIQEIEPVKLLLDRDDIRIKLQERNRKITNLEKKYVSGISK